MDTNNSKEDWPRPFEEQGNIKKELVEVKSSYRETKEELAGQLSSSKKK